MPDIKNGYHWHGLSAMPRQGVKRSQYQVVGIGSCPWYDWGCGFSPLAGADFGVTKSIPPNSIASLESVAVRSRFLLHVKRIKRKTEKTEFPLEHRVSHTHMLPYIGSSKWVS